MHTFNKQSSKQLHAIMKAKVRYACIPRSAFCCLLFSAL